MTVYVDTSVLVTLYIKEKYSRKASDWIRANNEAIPKTTYASLLRQIEQYKTASAGRPTAR